MKLSKVYLAKSLMGALLLFCALCASRAVAQERPITGKAVPALQTVDNAVLSFMDTIACRAATVAIAKDGQLLYARGFGWSDEAKKTPVAPDALMRIASVSKPITAAAINNAIRAGQLSLDTKAFALIEVKPFGGKVADARIWNITVAQLLAHQGGWDRAATFDPMFKTAQIEKAMNLRAAATPINIIEYMLTQPLQFAPGTKTSYSNFGYSVLGRVLETVMQKPFIECIQQSVFNPLGISDIKSAHSAVNKRDLREVWYPVAENAFPIDVMDAHGGLIASAPALCQFLQAYWINGEPRVAGEKRDWTSFGSLPGTTAMVRQREDGYNIAVLMNARRDAHFETDNETLKQTLDAAINTINR